MIRAIVIFLVLSLNAVAQIKEVRDIANFSHIKISHGIEVEYIHSDQYKVVVSADYPKLIGYIKTELKDDLLIISLDRSYREKNSSKNSKLGIPDGLKVYVESPELKGVKVSLQASFILKNTLKVDDFNLNVSSAGEFKGKIKSNFCEVSMSSSGKVYSDILASNKLIIKGVTSSKFNGNVNTEYLNINATNSSKIRLFGDVKDAEVFISTSANVDAEDLKTGGLDIIVSKSGLGIFNVTNNFKANVFSSGHLEYYGTPKKKDFQTSTGGVISNKSIK